MKNNANNTKKEAIELRISIKPDDELYKIFSDLKNASGIRSNSEVMRFALKQISEIPFSELMGKLKGKINT
ncbi:MAG: ribbon-helix-helix protein, CopG family [Candidatus Hodarchaeota archaeon]